MGNFMFVSPQNIHAITHDQPFCAGVIIIQNDCLLVTLNTDGLPPHLTNNAWRVGGVGGGQEPGESISECALREAKEELCTDVELVTSAVTYMHDIDTGEIDTLHCTDAIAPFLFECRSRTHPDIPYRRGLPTGPYLYFGLFLAKLTQPTIQPGDDVEGLLFFPIDQWSLLTQQPTLETVMGQGATIIETKPLSRTQQLWIPTDESFTTVALLLI